MNLRWSFIRVAIREHHQLRERMQCNISIDPFFFPICFEKLSDIIGLGLTKRPTPTKVVSGRIGTGPGSIPVRIEISIEIYT